MTESTLAAGAATAENLAAPADAATAPNAAAAPAAVAPEAGKDGAKPAAAPAPAGDENAAAPEPEGAWGNDWRERLAKSDEKRLAFLKRFASPEALMEAQEAAQRKISEGLKPKGKPGPKATAEEWAAYRKETGIPDAVEDYVKAIELPDKRVIGDDDKPIVEAFADRAIKAGIAPADLSQMVDQYYALQEEMQADIAKRDAEFKREAEKTLKTEFGGDYEGNFAAMRPYFEGVNGELFDNLMGGRLADGSVIGNHPDVLRFFVQKAVSENPMATIVPSGGAGRDSIDSEIAGYQKRMREDRDGWFKDTAAQERYQKLVSARDKLKG